MRTPVATYGEGRFLSGTLLTGDLAEIAELESARAWNPGDAASAEESNPFTVTALDAITLDPGTVELTTLDGVDVGALGQYAKAGSDGTAIAAAGAVGPNGAIGVSPAEGRSAIVDLGAMLGSELAAGIAGLRLEAAGIAAYASAELGEASGEYALADAKLRLSVPALAELDESIGAQLSRVDGLLAGIGGADGQIAQAVSARLQEIDLALALLDGAATVDVAVEADLEGVLRAVGRTVLEDQALTIDLRTGEIVVDLAALPDGPGLNDLPPGTELLSASVVGSIVDGVERLLAGYLDDLEAAIHRAIDAIDIHVAINVEVLKEVQTGERTVDKLVPVTRVLDSGTGEVLGLVDPVTGVVESVVDGITSGTLEGLLDGTLDGLVPDVVDGLVDSVDGVVDGVDGVVDGLVDEVDGLVDDVDGLVDGLLPDGLLPNGVLGGDDADGDGLLDSLPLLGGSGFSVRGPAPSAADLPDVVTDTVDEVVTVVEPILETLETSASVRLDATVDGLRHGNGVNAEVSASILGVPVALDASLVVGAVQGVVSGGLLDPVEETLASVDELDDSLIDSTLGDDALGMVLNDIVSVRANVQATGTVGDGLGSFTQTALQVSVLGGDAATLSLANATVATSELDPGTPGNPGDPGTPGDPGDPGTPGTPGNPGNPGNPGDPGTPGTPGGPGDPGAPGAPGEPGAPGGPSSPVVPAPGGGPVAPSDADPGAPGAAPMPGALAWTGAPYIPIVLIGLAILALGAWLLWRGRALAGSALDEHDAS